MGNAVLEHRVQEVLLAHGIEHPYILSTVKYFEHIRDSSMEQENSFINTLASYFELSPEWLQGDSSKITLENIQSCSVQQLILYLIQYKRSGWKPKIIFVKSEENDKFLPVMIFIELQKITKIGISFTVYKTMRVDNWEKVLGLCHKTGLYFRGLILSRLNYEALKNNSIIPTVALKDPLDLWYPDKTTAVHDSQTMEETMSFIEELCHGAIEPTCLYE